MSMLRKYNLFLSSSQRTSGDPSNFEIHIEPNIMLQADNSHFRIYIHSATIPFSFTQWSSVNNKTYIRLTQGGIDFDGSFTIPAGNYDILTFMTAWKQALETELQVLNTYFPNITYTYNSDTNKVSIYLPVDGTDSVITFYNTQDYSYVNKAIGFSQQWTLSVGNTSTSNIQCNINPARVLYMYSNTLASPHNMEALVSPCTLSTQIANIPITVLPNQYIVFQPFNYLVSQIGNKNMSKINIQLQSEDLPDNINLQNFYLDWSFVLVLEEWENAGASINRIEHLLALSQEKEKTSQAEIERQRQQLMAQREDIVNGLMKLRKKTKSSLDKDKEDVEQDN